MKFLFVAQGCLPIHAQTLEERPLGGIETGIIRVAEELKRLGHEVIVASTHPNPPLSEPLYIPLSAVGDVSQVDVLVVVRDWQPLLHPFRAKKRFFWTGDSYDQLHTVGLGDKRIMGRIDTFLAVSSWQADQISARSGFVKEKCKVIGNGVHLPYFEGGENRNPRRMIYSSTPYRGLDLLPGIFTIVKQAVPDVELHVFSDFAVYAGAGTYPKKVLMQYEETKSKLQQLEGVVFRGNILQRDLAREFMRSAILCYPNTFEETSCITALEAQAAGCAIVASSLGALPESTAGASVLVDPIPQTFIADFSAQCIELLRNSERCSALASFSEAKKTQLGWNSVATKLIEAC